jgi:hypothetical protein
MGKTTSKVTQEATNEAVTNFTMNLAKECSAGASNTIIFKADHVKGNYIMSGNKIDQTASVNLQCVQDSMSSAEIESKFKTMMIQDSETEGSPFSFLQSTSSEQNLKLTNKITSNLSMSDIQTCAAAASNTFKKEAKVVDGDFIVENNTISQAAEAIADCKQISDMSAKLTTNINNEIDQKNKTKAGSIFGGLFGDMDGIGSMVSALVVICCICCCCILVLGGGGFALYSSQKEGEGGQEGGGFSNGISRFLTQLTRKLKMALK